MYSLFCVWVVTVDRWNMFLWNLKESGVSKIIERTSLPSFNSLSSVLRWHVLGGEPKALIFIFIFSYFLMLILPWDPYHVRNLSSFICLFRGNLFVFIAFCLRNNWYHPSLPSSSTAFSVIFSLIVGSKSLNLNLCSSVKYCMTCVSSMGSPTSSPSTDGRHAVSRCPPIGVWRARARDRVCLPF